MSNNLKPFVNLLGFVAILCSSALVNAQEQSISLKTEMDTVSYGLGISIGENLKMEGLDGINVELVSAAIRDAFKGEPTLIDKEEAMQFLMAYFSRLRDSARAAGLAEAEPNRIAGENFLAENKKRPGVVTTESGLQYEILKEGNGEKPSLNDRVRVHYHGTLIDGTVFDSSVERGEPIALSVSGVIPGWTEALQLMPVGSKWKIYLPHHLAYGEHGAGPSIAPLSALIFDVELLEIVK